MNHKDDPKPTCSRCGCETDCCAFCDEPDCRHAICYQCVRIALSQVMSQPHTHGG